MTNLLKIRLEKGYTQLFLSQLSGINPRQIRRIESGESDIGNITLSNALALAEALQVDVKDLIDNV